MKILYLIPARKGSKGLPGKNTKIIGGKPLISFSIDFALENMSHADEICISTNDENVIKIAESKGISIPFIRPEELANDTASTYDVMIHAINYYKNINKTFDAILLLQPTSPIRRKEDLVQLIEEFDSTIDMVVSVKISKENPYFSLYEENEDQLLKKCKIGNYESRQVSPKVYAFNGSMYLMNIESLMRSKISDFEKIKKIEMPEERSIDIDTPLDWILAEYYLRNENS